MKNSFLLLITLFITSTFYAQDINFGVVLGGKISTTYADGSSDLNLVDNSGVISSYGGFYFDYEITERLGIKSDLVLTHNKLKTSNELITDDIKLNYIVLNPNIKYSFNKDYLEGMYLIGGPNFSFLTSAKSDNLDFKSNFKKINFGAQLGIGAHINNYFSIEGKFDAGVSNMLEDDSDKMNFLAFILTLNLNISALIK
ncbi:hypothetical protein ADIWIN_3193 [Winogradskyella psychrotolerans RS-3]|uniref:Outer membrane protein beta-barrel domain-containing protein n=1 Tax=Winogradskyella psychrotolerans RS-3 TaxID=641526 RepID=S7VP90_9FLAO|nr:outer membrane beta-barrel protein [Winogradskyella psychrotolerans]EPR71746.1 hypothetical protein ADIWIN_3193 [Winogradskyella psychrotolerans RS-3]